jgi:biopolymer transport protein ExbB
MANVDIAGDGGSLSQALALYEAGGPVVAVLAAMSVIGLAIVLLKLWQFISLRIGNRGFVEPALRHWRQGEADQALAVLESSRNPIAQVMVTAVRGRLRPSLTESGLREEVTRQAVGHLESLRSHLRGLEVIANLAPLLGLLGTVLGMIEAFQQLQSAGTQADPSVLSGGIWEALLTTAVGLIVAIPAVIALNWLERVIDRFRHRLEDAVTQVFTTAVPSEAEAARPERERPARQANAH